MEPEGKDRGGLTGTRRKSRSTGQTLNKLCGFLCVYGLFCFFVIVVVAFALFLPYGFLFAFVFVLFIVFTYCLGVFLVYFLRKKELKLGG